MSEMGWVQFKPCCKFFTYVTETQANLSTYSRKPGYHNLENYNGTIDFEIDTMKKSSPSVKIFVQIKFFIIVLDKFAQVLVTYLREKFTSVVAADAAFFSVKSR